MAGRMWVVGLELRHVEEGKRGQFWCGAAQYMLEPSSGMRQMKKALKDKDEGGLVYVPGQGYVHAEKDAVAVAAENDLVAGKSEVRTALLMAGTEDIPELFVQLGFLLTVEGEAVDLAFWLAASIGHAHFVGLEEDWRTGG